GQHRDGESDEEFPKHDRSSYEFGRDCPAMYPLRARTTRSMLRARTTSGCQPGLPLDSNAIRYWWRSSSMICRAAMLRCPGVLETNTWPPVHAARSASGPVNADRSTDVVEMSSD